MKCPVCSHDLVEYNAPSFKVDICRDGCSGIWFDNSEFEKCDEHSEPFPAELLRVRKVPDVVVDRSLLRRCPCCLDVTMQRVVMDPERRFEIDQCPSCEGKWLDIGELEALRRKNKQDRELEARMANYEEQVDREIHAVDAAYRVKQFLRKLLP